MPEGAKPAGLLLAYWLSNAFLFGLDWLTIYSLINGTDVPLVVPPAWTLGVELTFYLVAPLIVRRSVWLLIGLLASSITLRILGWLTLGIAADPWSYCFFPFELALFLLGALSYRIYIAAEDWRGADWLGYALIPAVLSFQFIQKAVTLWLPVWAHPLFQASFYVLAASAIPFLFRLTRESRFDQAIGDYSYPLYLVHVAVVELTAALLGDRLPAAARCLVVLAGSFAAAGALVKFVERPMSSYRRPTS